MVDKNIPENSTTSLEVSDKENSLFTPFWQSKRKKFPDEELVKYVKKILKDPTSEETASQSQDKTLKKS